MNQFIICIIVTYNPQEEYLIRVLKSVISNGVDLYVIDNSSLNSDKVQGVCQSLNVNLNILSRNIGIAAAQNIGITYALREKYEYIWFSDQDTLYQPDFAKKILNNIQSLLYKNIKLAGIGPSVFSEMTFDILPIAKLDNKFRLIKQTNELESVSHLISTGFVAPIQVFIDCGLMREDLFIDYVDFEWCWRCISLEYSLYSTLNTVVTHKMGDEIKKILGKSIVIRSDLRVYTICRNGVFLSLYSDNLPKYARLQFLLIHFKISIVYTLYSNKKLSTLYWALKGILHGVFRKLGTVY